MHFASHCVAQFGLILILVAWCCATTWGNTKITFCVITKQFDSMVSLLSYDAKFIFYVSRPCCLTPVDTLFSGNMSIHCFQATCRYIVFRQHVDTLFSGNISIHCFQATCRYIVDTLSIHCRYIVDTLFSGNMSDAAERKIVEVMIWQKKFHKYLHTNPLSSMLETFETVAT
jgi:hypothetical protein